jgi:hypothetical protein
MKSSVKDCSNILNAYIVLSIKILLGLSVSRMSILCEHTYTK